VLQADQDARSEDTREVMTRNPFPQNDAMPALFLSHGAPTLVFDDCPARDFLEGIAGTLPRPRAIVVMSAHYEAETPLVGGARDPQTIHDFRGFPDALYRLHYPAKGDPDLADDIVGRLRDGGFDAAIDAARGMDHGIWNPLMLAYPDADIPIVPLSIAPEASPAHHFGIGRALAPLRADGVLLVGSGSITHNLGRFAKADYSLTSAAEPFVVEFTDWIAERAVAGDTKTLLEGPETWPLGRENHPTDDHILPFFFALGAGERAERLHASVNFGILAMDAYAFR